MPMWAFPRGTPRFGTRSFERHMLQPEPSHHPFSWDFPLQINHFGDPHGTPHMLYTSKVVIICNHEYTKNYGIVDM